ncbi:MAG: DHHA1 domain-containing protein, partial [Planctomycetota bacterium]
EKLRQSGVPLIVTEHHAHQGDLPAASAIVHPGLNGYPNPDLCGAGVAFKLAWAIAQRISGSERVRPEFRELLSELLSLAALGTIADVVRLQGENRIIAKHGLDRLTRTRLPGLKALMEKAGLGDEKVSGYDVGFKLAPRINAAGRMGHACRAVELMTNANTARAFEIAMYLEDHNRTRQSTERRMTEQAIEFVDKHNLASDARRAIVWADEGWHPGVIGIVAARLVERFHRPTVLIAMSNGEGQGSGRSIRHFNLAAAFGSCGDHLISHGGHEMAAGLRIRKEKISVFSESFVELANQRLTGNDLRPTLRIDAEVSLRSLTHADVEAITRLGPFGMGNPRPKLATDWVELASEPRLVGRDEGHLQASFRQDGVVIRAIGFGLANRIEDLKQHRRCQVAFEPMINRFDGTAKVELQALDMRFPG